MRQNVVIGTECDVGLHDLRTGDYRALRGREVPREMIQADAAGTGGRGEPGGSLLFGGRQQCPRTAEDVSR